VSSLTGRNSDAYLLAWLGCARAGLVHVPANYALTAGELGYVRRAVRGAGADLRRGARPAMPRGACRGGQGRDRRPASPAAGGLDILATALDAEAPADIDLDLTDTDLAQLLYTSGTTAAPKGRDDDASRRCSPST